MEVFYFNKFCQRKVEFIGNFGALGDPTLSSFKNNEVKVSPLGFHHYSASFIISSLAIPSVFL